MEERRIQRVGRNTLTISLPYWWARKYGLNRGDVIYVEESSGGTLVLWPRKMEVERRFRGCSIDADLCHQPGLLQRLIIASYVLGVDLIEIFSKEHLRYTSIREIREAMESLMGVSIMKEDERHVVLQCFLNILNFPIHSLIRRMYDLAASMHKESIKALFEEDRDLARGVIIRDKEVNKMYYLLLLSLIHI